MLLHFVDEKNSFKVKLRMRDQLTFATNHPVTDCVGATPSEVE
jgi:hypothetical protein